MSIENPNQPSSEEQAAIETERTLSDAELIKGGAEYVVEEETGEKRLEVTEEQVEAAQEEMERAEVLKSDIENTFEKDSTAEDIDIEAARDEMEMDLSSRELAQLDLEGQQIQSAKQEKTLAELKQYNEPHERVHRIDKRKFAAGWTLAGGLGTMATGALAGNAGIASVAAVSGVLSMGAGIGLIGAPLVYGGMKLYEKMKERKLERAAGLRK